MHVDQTSFHASQVLFALLCAWIASGKGRSVLAWGILGAVFPVISVIFLLCLPSLPDEEVEVATEEAARLRKENRKLRAALSPPATPPGFDEVRWHVGVDDKPKGPLTLSELQELWRARAITLASYVWTPGMKRWCEIQKIPHLPEALSGK
jgi:hypothetical protein